MRRRTRFGQFRPNEALFWVLAAIFISYLLFVSAFGAITGY